MLPFFLGFFSIAAAKDHLKPHLSWSNNWYNNDVPALSIRYTFHLQAIQTVNFTRRTRRCFNRSIYQKSKFLGFGILSAVVIEDNLNLLAGGGVGIDGKIKTAVMH